jgi:hypothetical protein
VETLLAGWVNQAKEQEPELIQGFIRWMLQQLEHAAMVVTQSQQDLLDRYKARLDEAHRNAELAHQTQTQEWNLVLSQARQLEECLARLCAAVEGNGGAS